jgi:hypothetical protein
MDSREATCPVYIILRSIRRIGTAEDSTRAAFSGGSGASGEFLFSGKVQNPTSEEAGYNTRTKINPGLQTRGFVRSI